VITIKVGDITELQVDAVVNAAAERDAAIYRDAIENG
jgi:O-acetyl-ADP-ribose deacetylase (regulator of RNase III)